MVCALLLDYCEELATRYHAVLRNVKEVLAVSVGCGCDEQSMMKRVPDLTEGVSTVCG